MVELSNETQQAIIQQVKSLTFWHNPLTIWLFIAFGLLILAIGAFIFFSWLKNRDIIHVIIRFKNNNFKEYKFKKFRGEHFDIDRKKPNGDKESFKYNFYPDFVSIKANNHRYIEYWDGIADPIDFTKNNIQPTIVERTRGSLLATHLLEALLKFSMIEGIRIMVMITLFLVIIILILVIIQMFTGHGSSQCELPPTNMTIQTIQIAIKGLTKG